MTKAECYAQLKNLLPNASHQENTSEVGCTIMLPSCNRSDPLIVRDVECKYVLSRMFVPFHSLL